MPLALLLQETFGHLIAGAKRLEPWSQLSELETVLIGRARSAFLAHWFGSRLPTEGVALRIAFANLPDLQRRFRQMAEEARRRRAPEGGPSLFEPLAGFGGVLVGLLASPTGVLMAGYAIIRRGGGFVRVLLSALVLILAAGIVPVLAGGLGLLGLPAGVLGSLILAASNADDLRLLFGFFQELTALLEAALRFFNQLLGPRSEVRNPLIRGVLEIFDRLAVLFTHLVGLVAILVARLGPLLEPLAAQARALFDLTATVLDAVGFIIMGLINRLEALYRDPPLLQEFDTYLDALQRGSDEPAFTAIGWVRSALSFFGEMFTRPQSPWSVVKGVIGLLSGIGAVITRGVMRLARDMAEALLPIGLFALGMVVSWAQEVHRTLTDALNAHPVFTSLMNMRTALSAFKEALDSAQPVNGAAASPPAPRPPATPTPSTPAGPQQRGLLERLGRAILAVPELPNFSAIASTMQRAIRGRFDPETIRQQAAALDINTLAPELALTEEGRRHMREMLREPADPLAAERRRLRQYTGGPLSARMRALRDDELPLRQALVAVLTRLFPDAVAPYLSQMRDLFDMFDRRTYGLSDRELREEHAAEGSSEFPTLTVTESDRLHPVVRRLHLQVPQQDTATLMEWSERLQEMLRGQDYRVRAVE